ncbi:uncharacterized protein B0H18DRAFT_1049043 [Fomitopsis serialis]|uniref:uncharacterized protein n=1 Tax=Fomitopsis serialis TaxID=139415 RepID=UPI0020076FF4|nr:uncharacterized protein B0H18DRAFT_1049043 [Neoantrodia serialis]KAH9913377.1 hypothetical protein B0H18DRAFT_1049043 [Neoantrodia serialis]
MRGRENVSKAIVTEHQNTTGECFSSWERASDAARLMRRDVVVVDVGYPGILAKCLTRRGAFLVLYRERFLAFAFVSVGYTPLFASFKYATHRRGQASHRSRALGPLAVTSYKQCHSRPHSKDAPGSSSTSSTNWQVMKDHISTPDLPCSLSSRNRLACPLDCLSPSVSISDYSCDAPPRVHSYLRMLGARDMVLGAYAYVLLMQPF